VPRVGTHSMGRAPGSVSQRNGGVGELSFALTSRLAFEDPPAFPSADVLEAGNHKKPIPAIDRPQQSFRRLLSNLTPPGTRSLPRGLSPFVLFKSACTSLAMPREGQRMIEGTSSGFAASMCGLIRGVHTKEHAPNGEQPHLERAIQTHLFRLLASFVLVTPLQSPRLEVTLLSA
jgi:hypothetical protein